MLTLSSQTFPAKGPYIAIAPMMDYTDRYGRYFMRLLSKHVRLYTEMLTTAALLHGDRAHLLKYDAVEHPVALQLGGSDPAALATSARLAVEVGYDEINLNVGCPSDRVHQGHFGACLMAEPGLVAECVAAMTEAVSVPITVKTRIGIDHQDSYEALCNFISTVANAGCSLFIIHARKAWLQGLSPKENRTIPPLRYDVVAQLKKDFPQLSIVLNGGIKTLSEMCEHLQNFDGVMIGRAAFENPYMLAELDRGFYGDASQPLLTRQQVLASYLAFAQIEHDKGISLYRMLHPIMGLWQGQPGARAYRRLVGESMRSGAVGFLSLQKYLEL